MKNYLFTVHKQSVFYGQQEGERHFTSYTMSVAQEAPPLDLVGYATQLVTAERCLAHSLVDFPYVLAYEVEEGKLFDATTKVHAFFPNFNDPPLFGKKAAGYRTPDQPLDRRVVLQMGRNRQEGRVTKKAIGASVFASDILTFPAPGNKLKSLKLRSDGNALKYCVPLYSSIIAPLVGLDENYHITETGAMTPAAPVIGAPLYCHTSDLRMARRKIRRAPAARWEFETLVENSLKTVLNELVQLNKSMDIFTYMWDSGAVPTWVEPFGTYSGNVYFPLQREASKIYFDLCVLLGWLAPEAPNRASGYGSVDAGREIYGARFGSLIVKKNLTAILSCIVALWSIHVYFIEINDRAPKIDYGNFSTLKQQQSTFSMFWYEEWPTLMAATQGMLSSLAVLKLLVEPENPPKARGTIPAPIYYARSWEPPSPDTPAFQEMRIDWFEKWAPRERGDIIPAPQSDEVVVTLPPTPVPEGPTVTGPDTRPDVYDLDDAKEEFHTNMRRLGNLAEAWRWSVRKWGWGAPLRSIVEPMTTRRSPFTPTLPSPTIFHDLA
jgi:hypothetical protein